MKGRKNVKKFDCWRGQTRVQRRTDEGTTENRQGSNGEQTRVQWRNRRGSNGEQTRVQWRNRQGSNRETDEGPTENRRGSNGETDKRNAFCYQLVSPNLKTCADNAPLSIWGHQKDLNNIDTFSVFVNNARRANIISVPRIWRNERSPKL